ncbi:hypothetical protein BCR39DRAFT_550848 [Naematelia encephala]|uniref:CUE domain-containing protein n=1 Tax=Naematelia encephala TaxID=71784 RepID=A0A1Y2AKJ4_9TREE|nr:hypothetical protein BCR39DRAFT_550848 [Naematelia encephala]
MSGFQNAGVTKGIMMVLAINTLAVSLLHVKPYIHLQVVPHMTKYHQFWRLLVHPFAFANSTELLMGELLLYNVGTNVERSFGPRKYSSFILLSSLLSTFICFVGIVVLHKFGVSAVPAGPYGVIFSLLWQQYRTIPSLYAFRLFGIEFSSKIFSWLFALQLFLSYPPRSVLASLAGLLAGWIYRLDNLVLLPSLSRRRVLRPLKTYRIPLSIHTLLARLFEPLAGSSLPPRRSVRVLPGQMRESSARTTTASTVEPSTLRSLLSSRIGAGAAPPRPPRPSNGTTETGSTVPPPSATGSARAAMGEWVSEMTGRGQGGARAPTEEEIGILSGMFPSSSREAVVRALQRSDHNTAQAVEMLLDESS